VRSPESGGVQTAALGGVRGRAAEDGNGQDAAFQVAAAGVNNLLLTLPYDYVWYIRQSRPAARGALFAGARRRPRRRSAVVRSACAGSISRSAWLARHAYQYSRPLALARGLVTRFRHRRG